MLSGPRIHPGGLQSKWPWKPLIFGGWSAGGAGAGLEQEEDPRGPPRGWRLVGRILAEGLTESKTAGPGFCS